MRNKAIFNLLNLMPLLTSHVTGGEGGEGGGSGSGGSTGGGGSEGGGNPPTFTQEQVDELVNAARTEVTAQLETVRGELTAAQGQVTTLTTERDALTGQVTTLTGERDTARTELAAAQTQVTTLTTERDALNTAVRTSVEAELDALPEEIRALAPTIDADGLAAVQAKLPALKVAAEKLKGRPVPKDRNTDPPPDGGGEDDAEQLDPAVVSEYKRRF